MNFKQIDEIFNGSKCQTRRIVKPNELDMQLGGKHSVVTYFDNDPARPRLKWQVGRDYAVSPGRGKPGVWWKPSTGEWAIPYTTKRYKYEGPQRLISDLKRDGWQPLRIVITAIRREPLQAITEADAVAEGCEPVPCSVCGGYGWFSDIAPDPNDPYYGEPIQIQQQCYCYGGAEQLPTVIYRELWESINGRGSWDANRDRDVWAITFAVNRAETAAHVAPSE